MCPGRRWCSSPIRCCGWPTIEVGRRLCIGVRHAPPHHPDYPGQSRRNAKLCRHFVRTTGQNQVNEKQSTRRCIAKLQRRCDVAGRRRTIHEPAAAQKEGLPGESPSFSCQFRTFTPLRRPAHRAPAAPATGSHERRPCGHSRRQSKSPAAPTRRATGAAVLPPPIPTVSRSPA